MIKQVPDELASFNDGLALGVESVMNSGAWVKLDSSTQESFEESYPPVGVPVVILFKQKRLGSSPFRAEVAVMKDQPDGDGGYHFVRPNSTESDISSWPEYWCLLPDPNAFE